jgi:hypothetical protein
MTDRPILFSAPMVRALIDGRKTQTRRLAHRRVPFFKGSPHYRLFPTNWQGVGLGDRLWVRETFRLRADQDHKPPSQDWWKSGAWYEADGAEPSGCGGGAGKKRAAIHMPRWASRLTLEVTETHRHRLQAIAISDARDEGVDYWPEHIEGRRDPFPVERFKEIWIALHGVDCWDANPEVMALTFVVHNCNIDAMPKREAA